jgi:hypothetical protein
LVNFVGESNFDAKLLEKNRARLNEFPALIEKITRNTE